MKKINFIILVILVLILESSCSFINKDNFNKNISTMIDKESDESIENNFTTLEINESDLLGTYKELTVLYHYPLTNRLNLNETKSNFDLRLNEVSKYMENKYNIIVKFDLVNIWDYSQEMRKL